MKSILHLHATIESCDVAGRPGTQRKSTDWMAVLGGIFCIFSLSFLIPHKIWPASWSTMCTAVQPLTQHLVFYTSLHDPPPLPDL